MESTIKLFKALPIKTEKKKIDKRLFKKTIKFGFVFSPEVIANYSNYDALIDMIRKTIGITAEELNNSFHKSWQKIKEADLEDLVVEQLAHYMTTYGKESPEEYLVEKEIEWDIEDLSEKVSELNDIEMDKIWDKDYIYIPKEVLKIPKLNIDDIKLVVIKGYTKEQLREKLINLLNSGIALTEETLKAVLDIATFVELQEKEISNIKNKEVKSALYDYLNMFPENPTEFLRFAVYKTTNKTLLIKNEELIKEIKEKSTLGALKLFQDYDKKYGLKRLAEIFYRFKPILLAFRTNKGMKTITNRIRKLAVKYHKPLPEDYLNLITFKLKNQETINKKKLEEELEKVNIFRKIRLAYALKFRTTDIDSILYRIRNGKGWATEFKFNEKDKAKKILQIVLNSIAKDISKNVKGKKIFIPSYINYTLPSTEKQFIGYFPSGTYVSIPKDMVFGIHWYNTKNSRIDLDLSLISLKFGKVGWDACYRTDDRKILFSGDMTDASKPKGATELFYIGKQNKDNLLLFVNFYNFSNEIEVPFKIIIAQELVKDFGKNYMVNPNNILAIASSKINVRQKVIGLITTTEQENRFYFAEANIGQSITSSETKFATHSRNYFVGFYENTIGLKEILEKAGAEIIKNKEKADIDLSPESIEKDTIINLLTKQRLLT